MDSAQIKYRQIYDFHYLANPNYGSSGSSPGVKYIEKFLLRDLSGLPHLDVGCGHGHVCNILSKRGFDVIGFDVSTAALGVARSLYPDINFVSSIDTLSGFGSISCFDVLEHLDLPDAISLWDKMCAMLSPGGDVIASISTRPSVSVDHKGENLHRTVQSEEAWIELLKPSWMVLDLDSILIGWTR